MYIAHNLMQQTLRVPKYLRLIQLMKGKTLRKQSLHEKKTASVLLKLFISGRTAVRPFYIHINANIEIIKMNKTLWI